MSDHCPTCDHLKQYVLGELEEMRVESIDEHVENCDICAETVRNLEAETDYGIDIEMSPLSSDAGGSSVDDELIPMLKRIRPASSKMSLVGKRLRDYEIIEQIGAGGMGAVYKARHLKLDRALAIKVLPESTMRDEHVVARFEREMRAVGRLSHPNIVQATDAGDVDGVHFLAMDLVGGPDLSKIVKTCGVLSVADACELARQAALGLQYAHDNQLVHRDIKPSNLLLADDGTVKILDMGLALLHEDQLAGQDDDGLTSSGQIMGTVEYMAPEQAADTHSVDHRADIYSLGCTLFYLLAGRSPYRTEAKPTLGALIVRHATTTIPSLCRLRDDVPEELDRVIQKSLAKNADDRYASASVFAQDLRPFTDEADLRRVGTAHAPAQFAVVGRNRTYDPAPTSVFTQPSTTRRKIIWPLIASTVALLAIVAGVIFTVATNNGDLIVEVDPSIEEQVHVKVLRGESVINDGWSLKPGNNQLTISTGPIQVELPASLADKLRLDTEADELSIERGGKIVFRVQRAGTPKAFPDEPPETTAFAPQADTVDHTTASVQSPPTSNPLLLALLGVSDKYEWSQSMRVASINTKGHDFPLSLSDDGLRLSIRSGLPGKSARRQLTRASITAIWEEDSSEGAALPGSGYGALHGSLVCFPDVGGLYVAKRQANGEWTPRQQIDTAGYRPLFTERGEAVYYIKDSRSFVARRVGPGLGDWSDPKELLPQLLKGQTVFWLSDDMASFIFRIGRSELGVGFFTSSGKWVFYLVPPNISRLFESYEMIILPASSEIYTRNNQPRSTTGIDQFVSRLIDKRNGKWVHDPTNEYPPPSLRKVDLSGTKVTGEGATSQQKASSEYDIIASAVETEPTALTERQFALMIIDGGGAVTTSDSQTMPIEKAELLGDEIKLVGVQYWNESQLTAQATQPVFDFPDIYSIVVVAMEDRSNLKRLDGVASLNYLGFIGRAIDDEVLTFFRKSPVTQLSIDGSSLTSVGVEYLSKTWPNLKYLKLTTHGNSTSLDDDSIEPLAKLKKLTSLNLTNANITDDCVETLIRIKTLKTMELRGTRISEEGKKRIVGALPSISSLP